MNLKEKLEANNKVLLSLIETTEQKLLELSDDVITNKRNSQNRSIKQIVGHLVDSATNNVHRIVNFQLQSNPMVYPDYAGLGNNDKWIAVQDYQNENWQNLVALLKYSNLHLIHVFKSANLDNMDNYWLSAEGEKVAMKDMALGYLEHFRLHIAQINELIEQ